MRKRLQWFHLLIGVQLVVCFLYFLARLTASLSQNTIQPLGISLCPSTEDCTQWQVVLARFVYDSTVRCTPLVLGGLFIFECSLLNYDAEQLARYIDVCEVRNDETILAVCTHIVLRTEHCGTLHHTASHDATAASRAAA